ncbi:MAG: hypothetical protein IK011_05720 [Bacteroidaceae bacterium]|nr:hypothetical protein [Bacteroidaceae bacterium]
MATDTPLKGVSVACALKFYPLEDDTDTPDTCWEKVHLKGEFHHSFGKNEKKKGNVGGMSVFCTIFAQFFSNYQKKVLGLW